MSHKILLGLWLFAIGCESIPRVPHHVKYGIYPRVSPPGFYGVDNETKARVYKEFMAPEMAGGQCLTAQDYKEWTAWVQAVKQIAEQRCR